jgi:tetratricopeptide (TPR) repeat protein
LAIESDPDLPEALNNMAWLLATSPDDSLRNGSEAVRLDERACALTRYRVPALVGALAAAYAEAGRFDDAITTAQKACALASQNGEQGLLKMNQQLMQLYRAHRAYHEKRK